MIAYEDLQYLVGLYVIIFLFYYGFFMSPNRSLLKYDDERYLSFELRRLGEEELLSPDEAMARLERDIRRKNAYSVFNMIFFVFYVASFFVFLRLLASNQA